VQYATATSDNTRRAAQLLVKARRDREMLADMSQCVRPTDALSALAVQDEVSELLVAAGEQIKGWKCASPTGEKIVVAPIYATGIHQQGGGSEALEIVARRGTATVQVEPELAIVLGCDLPVRGATYSETEIDAAVSGVSLALEIIASRYRDPAKVTFPELLADGLLNSGLVLSRPLSCPVQSIPASFEVRVVVAGESAVCHVGAHPETNVLRPLYWMVNFLRQRGVALRAGQVVITGSYAGVLCLPVGRTVRVEYGALGALCVRFVCQS
jgi:2-keto-4-pentenoate hydratase